MPGFSPNSQILEDIAIRDPALAIVLAAARPKLGQSIRQRLDELLSAPFDWGSLLAAAEFHKVLPQVIAHIEAVRPGYIPQDLRDNWLDGWLKKIAGRAENFSAILLDLTQLFKQARIDVLAFKGPILSAVVYDTATPRDYYDLDLLIRHTDIPLAHEILAKSGFARQVNLPPRKMTLYEAYHFAYTYTGPERNVGWSLDVDLHWALLPMLLGKNMSYEELAARATTLKMAGQAIPVFSVEDTLVYLTVHGGKEQWKRLRTLMDLSSWIKSHAGLDWQKAEDIASAFSVTRMFRLGLRLAAEWHEANVPPRQLQAAREDKNIDWLIENITQRFIARDRRAHDMFEVQPYFFKLMDNFGDSLKYATRTIMTPRLKHIEMIGLPPSLSFAYMPIKFIHDYCLLPMWRLLGLSGKEKRIKRI